MLSSNKTYPPLHLIYLLLLLASLLALPGCGRPPVVEEAPPARPETALSQPESAPEAAPLQPESTPIVVAAAGDITAAVEEYRHLLGETNHGGEPGTQGDSGYREINWDGMPDEVAAPNFFDPGFFNAPEAPRARGILLETPGDGLMVSANADNPYGVLPRFGNINPQYSDIFKVFSEERLFSPIGSHIVNATFYVPGTNQPAVVTGFGAVYTDVDTDHTAFEYFDIRGNSLGRFNTPIADEGLSFLGVIFAEPIIHRVEVRYGTGALGPNDGEGGVDVAVMDNFIYGEPQAVAVTFIGEVAGTDIFVGLATDGRKVVAYVCDGQSISQWFQGEVNNAQVELVSAGDARLQFSLAGGLASGSLTLPGGAAQPFTAIPAAEQAGLYRAEEETEDGRYVAGWVVLADGRQRGLVNLITDGTSNTVVGTVDLVFAGPGGGPHVAPNPILSFSDLLISSVIPVDQSQFAR